MYVGVPTIIDGDFNLKVNSGAKADEGEVLLPLMADGGLITCTLIHLRTSHTFLTVVKNHVLFMISNGDKFKSPEVLEVIVRKHLPVRAVTHILVLGREGLETPLD